MVAWIRRGLLLVLLPLLASCPGKAAPRDTMPPRRDGSGHDRLPSGDLFHSGEISGGRCNASTCAAGCCKGTQCVMPATDTACGKGGAACVDCTETGTQCSAGSCAAKAECTFEGGCADSGKYCDVGKCVACPAGKFNCDNKGQCECEGGCNGTACQGPTSCDYYDQNVCGGDTSKWCWNNQCTSCTTGFFNCNNTKGCECDAAGCNGTACAGKCSGGEC